MAEVQVFANGPNVLITSRKPDDLLPSASGSSRSCGRPPEGCPRGRYLITAVSPGGAGDGKKIICEDKQG
jgi:hypothetical protein